MSEPYFPPPLPKNAAATPVQPYRSPSRPSLPPAPAARTPVRVSRPEPAPAAPPKEPASAEPATSAADYLAEIAVSFAVSFAARVALRVLAAVLGLGAVSLVIWAGKAFDAPALTGIVLLVLVVVGAPLVLFLRAKRIIRLFRGDE